MRILILSWEFPPHVVGGMGRHVVELIPALVEQGEEVHVITPTFNKQDTSISIEEEVTVHRVFTPAFNMEASIYDQVVEGNKDLWNYISQLEETYDVIHVHDWLTSFVGLRLQKEQQLPLIVTIHATEKGRSRGHLSNDLQRAIDQAERQIITQANQVIVCSRAMSQEVQSFFGVSKERLSIIPNGIDLTQRSNNSNPEKLAQFRAKYAKPEDKIIFTVARLVYQKGIHRLIDAAPQILKHYPQACFIVAGKGPEAENLKNQAKALGVSNRVNFVGFISDEERDMFYQIATCAIFPSLYEPFGIVALEAMALGCPVIVSDIGGLTEVVKHTETGITTYPDDANSVAWGILHTLAHPEWSQKHAHKALKSVEELFNWPRIARLTRGVYRRAFERKSHLQSH